jgi:tetratricopeptide (TPR) repeat protein
MSKVATTPARIGQTGVILGALALLAGGGLFAFFWFSPDAETLARRASQEFMAREFDLAEADIARVSRMRSPTPLDWMLRAQIAVVKGREAEAIEALGKVPDEYPMAWQARLEAGQLELRRNRYVAAEELFLAAIKLDPKRAVQARRELVYIYGMQLRRPELNANFRELAEIAPLNDSQVFLWCLTRGVSWDAAEIIDTLKKCLDADPNDRWARIGMAEQLCKLTRFDEAEAAVAPLPESDPIARATRVRIALERGDDQTAESLLAGGPADNLNLALLRGRFALARGNGPEAVRQFRIAHDQAPNLREAVLGLGQALKTTGNLTAAGPLLEEGRKHERLGGLVQRAAVEENRNDPALMRDLGDACAAIGRYPEARAWFNLAITRDLFDTQAQQGLARVKQLEEEAKARSSVGKSLPLRD